MDTCKGADCQKICGGGKGNSLANLQKKSNLIDSSKNSIIPVQKSLTKSDIVYYKPFWNHHHYYKNYPFYPFYWYFADHFYSHYPYYYSYFLHYHPTVIQNFRGSLIFDNHFINPSDSGITVFQNLKENANTLKSCKNGPKFKFTAQADDDKKFRVFIGDVNDFFNIERGNPSIY